MKTIEFLGVLCYGFILVWNFTKFASKLVNCPLNNVPDKFSCSAQYIIFFRVKTVDVHGYSTGLFIIVKIRNTDHELILIASSVDANCVYEVHTGKWHISCNWYCKSILVIVIIMMYYACPLIVYFKM